MINKRYGSAALLSLLFVLAAMSATICLGILPLFPCEPCKGYRLVVVQSGRVYSRDVNLGCGYGSRMVVCDACGGWGKTTFRANALHDPERSVDPGDFPPMTWEVSEALMKEREGP